MRHSERIDARRQRRELIYLAPGDVSKGRVEPILWMRTCEAYAQQGLNVTLMSLRIRRPDSIRPGEVWEHFGLERSFRIAQFPTMLKHDGSVAAFRLWAVAAASAAAGLCSARSVAFRASPIVHARAPVLLAPFIGLKRVLPRGSRPRIVFETHALPTQQSAWVVRQSDLVVVNSQALAADLADAFGIPSARLLYAPLPPHNLVHPEPRDHARAAIGVSPSDTIACYTGKMTREHNEFLLATAAEVAPRIERFRMLLVGGNPSIVDWTRSRMDSMRLRNTVILTGFVPPAKISAYQSAADVLLYHMPETMGNFAYTTPAKGFEYQAVERPIVATDFPLFHEVFGDDGERAIRVRDRTPVGLADGIVRALGLGDDGRAMTGRAASFVRGRTWQRRATQILEALG
ncbi:hypothetical protein BH18ACT13_BH18ACT13_01780 [soil metagenome]